MRATERTVRLLVSLLCKLNPVVKTCVVIDMCARAGQLHDLIRVFEVLVADGTGSITLENHIGSGVFDPIQEVMPTCLNPLLQVSIVFQVRQFDGSV